MSGKKRRIAERRVVLLEGLRRRYPQYLHLVDEFLCDKKLHNESELWTEYTEAGLAKLFADYLAISEAVIRESEYSLIGDVKRLAKIRRAIQDLESILLQGGNGRRLTGQLNLTIINPLEKLLHDWEKLE